jgi:hypothetical protein
MKPTTWNVLQERERNLPTEPRLLFRRQDKGSPRFYINIEAVRLMQLDTKTRVQLLAPSDSAGRPILGLRIVSEGGVKLRPSGATRSLCLVSSAALHLAKSYSRIAYRPRPGRAGEPEWVLEPVTSEKGAAT